MAITSFDGKYDFLSNFYEFPVEFTGADGASVAFPTNEHAFQAAKYLAYSGPVEAKVDYVDQILNAPTPAKAKYIGRSISINPGTWDAMRINVMREVCYRKFLVPTMRSRLLSTGSEMLVEGNTWGDTFWGRCEGRGQNYLGVILMELRGHFRFHEDWTGNAKS